MHLPTQISLTQFNKDVFDHHKNISNNKILGESLLMHPLLKYFNLVSIAKEAQNYFKIHRFLHNEPI